MSLSKRTVTLIAVAAVSVLLIGYLLMVTIFSGGIGGLISNMKPAPDSDSQSLSTKRESVKNSINNSFDELGSATELVSSAASAHDKCFEGQNNWKVSDGYAHRCLYRISNFYGFSGDFRSQVIDLEQQIINSGWSASSKTELPVKNIIHEYYDKYYGPTKPKPRNFSDQYLVSDLPTPTGGYTKDGMLLEIEYAEKDTSELGQLERAQQITSDTLFETHENKDFNDINAVFDKITANDKYLLVVSIQQKYFQN